MNHPVTALSRRYSLVHPIGKETPAVAGNGPFQLHRATCDAEFRIAHRLVHEAYVDAGYCDPTPDGRLTHYQEFDALEATRVYLLRQDQSWVGTVSVTRENALGLPIDETFLEDVRAAQREGRGVGVIWRLAVRPQYRQHCKAVTELFLACVRWALSENVETTFMMVHDRHQHFYRRCLRMRCVRTVSGVSKFSRIPVALMRCETHGLPPRWLHRAEGILMD